MTESCEPGASGLFSEKMEERIKAILVAADTGDWDVELSLSELRALCDTDGVEPMAEAVQTLEKPNSATYIGKGKVEEVKQTAELLEAELLIADDSLTGTQVRNLENATGLTVIDRTMLILDIFAQNARTAEGKLQVELAQLEYRLPRLTGFGGALSRQGAGIGTRGPGETKLETDRRHIRGRIASLKEKLADVERHRDLTRKNRQKTGIPTVALVGYTNVGKSSLLNALTGASVLAEDKLFATLDPTVRRLAVGNLQNVVLVDTVGFVSRLPHGLVKAFKSTLDEARYADLILIVADAASPEWPAQLDVTRDVLKDLGCDETPTLTVFNKCDLIDTYDALPGLHVSAATGMGLEGLLEAVSEKLSERVVRCRLLFPFDSISRCTALRDQGNIVSETWREDGLLVEATVDRTMWPVYAPFACLD